MLLLMTWACTGPAVRDSDPDLVDDTAQDSQGPDLPLDGLGTITGDCGELDAAEWDSAQPFFFRNALDLDAGFLVEELSEGGAKVYEDGNLGGSSIVSEVLAYELLYRCELASLLKTEGEIVYEVEGKKTDLLVDIDARTVGVSVTRAFHWPPEDAYTLEEAEELLSDKLADAGQADDNVAAEDAWSRTLLHVIAYDAQYADMVEQAWQGLGSVREDFLVIVTVTDGDDAEVY
jgi:hypothetical protein